MGIVNVTPDSFSDGGTYYSAENAIEHGLKLWDDGADVVDIGGESTRPGADPVSIAEELKRVIPVIEALSREGVPCSIDTYKSEVAAAAIESGASIINDVSGLRFDEKMPEVAAKYNTGLIIMHIKGTPRNMQMNPRYEDLIDEIKSYLLVGAETALKAGLGKNNIVLDPGIGFGKTLDNNLEILRNIPEFIALGFPVLIGPSRKSFIGRILDSEVSERLYGTIGACVYAAMNGADILRVHDPKEVSEAVKVAHAIQEISPLDAS